MLALSQKGYTATAAVVSAHALATDVGKNILQKGGSAADAAIAMAFTLAVVEPQHSGIGGGGLLLYYEKSLNRFTFVDYREALPQGFLSGSGVVAIPGFVLGMEKIHEAFGKMAWNELLMAAIGYAESGFMPSPGLLFDLNHEAKRLEKAKTFQEFYTNPLGMKKTLFVQAQLASTLKKIQESGAKEFYQDALSHVILDELAETGVKITDEDWSKYQVSFSKPLSFYFQDKLIVTTAAPSAGGKILASLLQTAREKKLESLSPEFIKFLEEQSLTIFKNTTTSAASHTTHISVIDSDGNIASMTNSLGDAFGSGIILPGTGVLLNNALKDIKTSSAKHPATYLTPTIVFKGFDPALVVGTSGGTTIPFNLFQILYRHLVEGDDLSTAIKAPKFYSFPESKTAFYEKGFPIKKIPATLKIKSIESTTTAGNVQAIVIKNGKSRTVSDPRGEGKGIVLGK